MSTIFVATSINLEGEEKKQFLDTIEGAVAEVFKCYSIYYTPVPKENCSECAKDQITFFVFVPPYMRSSAVASSSRCSTKPPTRPSVTAAS